MSHFRFPCTRHIAHAGFGAFLENNLGAARHNINSFANELTEHFGAKNVTLVNSGSSANLVAALAFAEKLRDAHKPLTALTAAFTFPTTLSALEIAGFKVRVVDTEEGGFNLSPAALETAMKEESASLVCLTHFLGFPAKLKEIANIAHNYGAVILQDACETMRLVDENQQPLFCEGDISTWSFYHPHHLSSFGGGAIICKTKDDQKLADSIAHWGRACTCHIDPGNCTVPPGPAHQFFYVRRGLNVEMSEINACFGRFQLLKWEADEVHRKENYAILYNRLAGHPRLTVYPAPTNNGSPFVFPITLNAKTAKLDATSAALLLAEKGIECRTLMGGEITAQPAYQHLAHAKLPNARNISRLSFFTGIHQTIPAADIHEVANILATTL